jgi:hypothetical protein
MFFFFFRFLAFSVLTIEERDRNKNGFGAVVQQDCIGTVVP